MLYIDFDINKNFEIKAIIYYVFENVFKNVYSLRFNIRFIFFLNRLLKDIKIFHWFTKLKFIDII